MAELRNASTDDPQFYVRFTLLYSREGVEAGRSFVEFKAIALSYDIFILKPYTGPEGVLGDGEETDSGNIF